MEKDYLSVIYDEKRAPKTDYPSKLAAYLIKRFNLRNGERLLEIGCGRGDFLMAFHNAGLNCAGVDTEEKALGLARSIDVRRCDISKDVLPFDNDTFDVVYHKSLIEHLYDPSHLMNETYRVLKEGGRVIILTPDWKSQMKNFSEDFTHRRPYAPTAVRDLLEIWGFKYIISERFYQLPILWRCPFLKVFSIALSTFISVDFARQLTLKTNCKFFRFSVELMILGYGRKL